MKLKIIQRYENAIRRHEMLGALDPEEWPEIEREYEEAQRELLRYIQWLERRKRK